MADVTQTIGQKAMNMFNRMVGGQKSGLNRGFGEAFGELMGMNSLRGMKSSVGDAYREARAAGQAGGDVKAMNEAAKTSRDQMWGHAKNWVTGQDRILAGGNNWNRAAAIAGRAGAVGAGMAAIDFFNPFGFGWND